MALAAVIPLGLAVICIIGMVYAWQERVRTVPLVGTWVVRLPCQAEPAVAVEAEAIKVVM